MKKVFSLLLALFICFGLLAGCTSKPVDNPDTTTESTDGTSEGTQDNSPLSLLRKRIMKDACEVGIAFIGYVDSEGNKDVLSAYLKGSDTAAAYPFLNQCEPIDFEGSELYALVPASENASITVYQSIMLDNGEYENHRELVVYRGEPGETVVLRCNLSELYSNVLISVTGKTNELEFHPTISMMDGKLVIEKGCFNFSV